MLLVSLNVAVVPGVRGVLFIEIEERLFRVSVNLSFKITPHSTKGWVDSFKVVDPHVVVLFDLPRDGPTIVVSESVLARFRARVRHFCWLKGQSATGAEEVFVEVFCDHDVG